MTTEPAEKGKMTQVWIRIDPTITVMELALGAQLIDCALMADSQGLRLDRCAPKPRKGELENSPFANTWTAEQIEEVQRDAAMLQSKLKPLPVADASK